MTTLAFTVPPDAQGPITLSAWVHYRKFDTTYLTHVFPDTAQNTLPVMTLAQAKVEFAVGEAPAPAAAPAAPAAPATPPAGPPEWERWYDAAIGAFRVADRAGDKGQWGVADDAFRRVAELGRVEGWIGRARSSTNSPSGRRSRPSSAWACSTRGSPRLAESCSWPGAASPPGAGL